MASTAKLLLVALCGAVLATAAVSVEAAVEPAAYRGGAVGSVAQPVQQQATAAAGQPAAAARLQATAAAYRDSE